MRCLRGARQKRPAWWVSWSGSAANVRSLRGCARRDVIKEAELKRQGAPIEIEVAAVSKQLEACERMIGYLAPVASQGVTKK